MGVFVIVIGRLLSWLLFSEFETIQIKFIVKNFNIICVRISLILFLLYFLLFWNRYILNLVIIIAYLMFLQYISRRNYLFLLKGFKINQVYFDQG